MENKTMEMDIKIFTKEIRRELIGGEVIISIDGECKKGMCNGYRELFKINKGGIKIK